MTGWCASLQYVEFAALEDASEESADEEDDDLRLPNPNAEKANSKHGKSLEVLLATKNKRILEELTKFRVCRRLFAVKVPAPDRSLRVGHAGV